MLLSNLLIYMGFYMLVPTLPAYAKQTGGSNLEASLVVSLFSITSLIFRLLMGTILDNFDIKPLLIIGTIILGASTLSFIWLPLAAIIIVRIIQGIGWGIASTATAAIFTNLVPEARRGEGMGYYSLSMIVSMSLAPVVAIIIMNLYSFKYISIFSLGLVLTGTLLIKAVTIPKNNSNINKQENSFSFLNLFEKNALLPSFLCFLLTITLCGIMSYIMLYGKELSMANIGLYFIGHVTMILITRPFIGKIFDKKGHVMIVIPGSISMIAGLIILSYTHTVLVLIIASLFYGLGYGAVQPSLQVWAVNRSPEHRKGAANGTFLSSMDLAFTLGSILLSFIAESKSYAFMYRFSAFFLVILLAVYGLSLFMNSRKQNYKDNKEDLIEEAS
jgi:MFS family permease